MLTPRASDEEVAALTRRLFAFRKQQPWPSPVLPGPAWGTLYATAADGLDVIAAVTDAAQWANGYIATLTQH